MIRLGHIQYSNCIPVHALLLDEGHPDVELVRGVPSTLNRSLAEGTIDAAPCSSIEYARHEGEYHVLPHHVIGSAGAVQSILLEAHRPLHELDGRRVAVPTASATSVVLLRILLELRLGVRPEYSWFDQAQPDDPLADDAAAALRIGDVALSRVQRSDRHVYDLGAEWFEWTGLPFAFAIWQVRRGLDADRLRRLAALLAESRAYFDSNAPALAERYAAEYGIPPARLLTYWRSLCFDLDAPMQQGLLHFFSLAAELGEAPPVDRLAMAPL